MNLATKRVLQASEAGQYQRALDILRGYGHLIGHAEGIEWWALGDDVLCRQSFAQIEFSGCLSQAPYFRAPRRWAAP